MDGGLIGAAMTAIMEELKTLDGYGIEIVQVMDGQRITVVDPTWVEGQLPRHWHVDPEDDWTLEQSLWAALDHLRSRNKHD